MPPTRRSANKSPAIQPGKRKTANSKKNSNQNLIQNTSKFVVASEEFIPLVSVSEERKGGSVKNKHKDDKMTIIIDENSLNEDFIPLNFPESSKNVGEKPCKLKVCDNAVTSSTGVVSETIVIDDDGGGGDILCSVSKDGCNEINLVNDSLEIIAENSDRKDCCRKRKCDDSIEICLDTFNFTEPTTKRAKIIPLASNSIAKDERTLPGSSTASDENKNNQDDDDEIVIIDSDDKLDGIEVLKEFPLTNDPRRIVPKLSPRKLSFRKWTPRKWSSPKLSPQKLSPPKLSPPKLSSQKLSSPKLSVVLNRRKRKNGNTNKQTSTTAVTTFAFEDTRGTTNQNTTKYKSPLTSVSNSNLESNGSYCNVVGNNIYNPNSVEKIGLRPVVIDGSNVAFSHGGNGFFSTRGLQICVNYFLQRNHMVVAFVPLFRRSFVSVTDKQVLDDLHSKRLLSFTPSRLLQGRRVTSYDDRFIVQCAAELGGVVVSTDNYRDLVEENEAWRDTIENRLLMFTWVGDLLMFPDDPCGRTGPRLEEFLRFPP